MSGKIFINYRRSTDWATARLIYDYLARNFGTSCIFIDVDGLSPGINFVKALALRVSECDIFLSIIGTNWTDTRDEAGKRRIDNPSDWVRIEIASAILQEKYMIPILVNNASPLSEDDLPPDLKTLAQLQAFSISPESFNRDMQALNKAITWIFQQRAEEKRLSAEREAAVREAEEKRLSAEREAAAREAEEKRALALEGRINQGQLRHPDQQSFEIKKNLTATECSINGEIDTSGIKVASSDVISSAIADALEAEGLSVEMTLTRAIEDALAEAKTQKPKPIFEIFIDIIRKYISIISTIYSSITAVLLLIIAINRNKMIKNTILLICASFTPILISTNFIDTNKSKVIQYKSIQAKRKNACEASAIENQASLDESIRRDNKTPPRIIYREILPYITMIPSVFSDSAGEEEVIDAVRKSRPYLETDGEIVASPLVVVNTEYCR